MERSKSGNILFTRSEFADCVLQPTDSATLITDVSDSVSAERLNRMASFAKTELGVNVKDGETIPTERGMISLPISVAKVLLEELVDTVVAVNDDDTGEGWLLPEGFKEPALERCIHLRDTVAKLLVPKTEN